MTMETLASWAIGILFMAVLLLIILTVASEAFRSKIAEILSLLG